MDSPGSTPEAGDIELYRAAIEPDLPASATILADADLGMEAAIPWEDRFPFQCAVSPEMEILDCRASGWAGDLDDNPVFQAILAHYERNNP